MRIGRWSRFVAVVLSFSALRVGAQWKLSAPLIYTGMCDASAAVALDTNWVAVANDEDNQLRIYDAEQGGAPVRIVDLTGFLGLTGKFPETDIEGAAWLGGRIFWITSHGRSREGKYRPNRHRFFATEVRTSERGQRLVPVGIACKNLLMDMLRDERLRLFRLGAASARAPKTRGGLNIEGLCATLENHLLIGFRNPIPNGRALVVPLLNPTEVIIGKSAKFGPPMLLDLGGLGIRDMGYRQKKFLIIAGPYDAEKDFRLYRWDGLSERPELVPGLDFHGLSPEALVFYSDRAQFQILSDDGTLKIQGVNCKLLRDPTRKRFQAVWVTP